MKGWIALAALAAGSLVGCGEQKKPAPPAKVERGDFVTFKCAAPGCTETQKAHPAHETPSCCGQAMVRQ